MLKGVDKLFFGLALSLVIIGIFIFISASLGVLAKDEAKFTSILASQLLLGVGMGLVLFVVALKVPTAFWKRNAFFIFIGACILTALVYIPGLGFSHGGAQRWVSLGPVSFQPAEFLKVAAVIYAAGWFSWKRRSADTFKHSIVPLGIMILVCAGLLLPQPDTKNLILIAIAILGIAFVAGMKWKHLFLIGLVALIGLSLVVATRDYALERVKTFVDPSRDPQGSSYQLRQSYIAIGSGKLLGRGLGQSVQKFSYLPEPQGDSVFAVIGEEFGFIGSALFIILLLGFVLRGYKISALAKDSFESLLVVGIITLIAAQSFMNIASVIGIFPLTGVPLVFVSHGGTSLMLALGMVGMIARVSKNSKK